MAKSNKQQLDELLGILDEMKGGKAATPPPPPQPTIPDDLPESGTEAVSTTPPPVPKAMPPADTVNVPKPQVPVVKHADDGMLLEQADNNEVLETQRNLAEIDNILDIAKNVMQHVYGVVTSTDILDAATIAAAAKLINETRGLVQEHLEIQRAQREFLNKIQMEEIKHRHQMELMEKKFELEQKRYQQKNPPVANAPANNVQPVSQVPAGMKSYSSADLRKMLDQDG